MNKNKNDGIVYNFLQLATKLSEMQLQLETALAEIEELKRARQNSSVKPSDDLEDLLDEVADINSNLNDASSSLDDHEERLNDIEKQLEVIKERFPSVARNGK